MKLCNFLKFTCKIVIVTDLFSLVKSSINIATTLPPNVYDIVKNTDLSKARSILNVSRRIIDGEKSHNSRPYMVYLKLPTNDPKYKNYHRWLCAGVIVHEEYILTSAACIEDAKHFYVVSGTSRKLRPEPMICYEFWKQTFNEKDFLFFIRFAEGDDRYNNLCIKNGAKKAIWKCIPRNYVFDGHENDNIRWMNNDIAIVKVEDEFDFTHRVKGCDFIPKPICYNNQSSRFEDPGQTAIIAGWGSTEKYNDPKPTSQDLLETSVLLISKSQCKKRWGPRYHNIIDNYMICSRDIVNELSEVCNEKYVECTDITYSDENLESRRVINPNQLSLHSGYHNDTRRVNQQQYNGGFCENDHGGPLIHGEGASAMVIGIISACLVKEQTNKCYGPFLYTSVYKNRILINCAIYKDVAGDCTKIFRSGDSYREEELSWNGHPDGPAKNEMRRSEDKRSNNVNPANDTKQLDKVMKHGGVILRTHTDHAAMKLENTNSTV